MKRAPLAVLCLLSAVFTCPALAQVNYSKTIEVGPLRISYSELQAVLDKSVSLVNASNGSTPLRREEMRLRAGGLRVEMSGHRLEEDRARLTQVVDQFEYTLSTRDTAPITRLSLSFSDYSRTLTVEGKSPNQVDAVFSALRDDLLDLASPIGGKAIWPVRFVVAWVLGWTALFLGAWWFHTRRAVFLGPLILSVAIVLALILLPIGDWLAGFALVRGEASFAARYGAQISLWGLIVGIVALGLSLIPVVIQMGGQNARGAR